MSRILAYGHSHIAALQAAYGAIAQGSTPRTVWSFKQLWGLYDPFFRVEGSQICYNGELETEMVRLSEQAGDEAVLLGCLIGSEHFLWSVQGQARPFDIVLPFDDVLPRVPGAELLPYSLAYRFVRDAISAILGFNGRLQALTGRPVYQLLPPPPVARQERVLASAPGPIRAEMLAVGVPHPIIRYKLWRLWVAAAEDIAESTGVRLCEGLPEATDEDGMLLEEFCGDAVHGNERYGLLAIRRFEELVG